MRPTHLLIAAAVAALCLFGPSLQPSMGQPGVPFVYRSVKYIMDPFPTLFGSTALGTARSRLFVGYLQHSAEGQERANRAGSDNAEKVWATLDVEEQTTFLAVTAAAHALTNDQNVNVLDWFSTLEQIHGSTKPFGGGDYKDNEAYRVYVKLTPAGVAHVLDNTGSFKDACAKKAFGYGAGGSRHPDFCRLPSLYDDEGKTGNAPNLQFNVTENTGCADVDLDFDTLFTGHLTKDNSNVLAHANARLHTPHLRAFVKQYCDPGFRR